jgi:hypothetical protein
VEGSCEGGKETFGFRKQWRILWLVEQMSPSHERPPLTTKLFRGSKFIRKFHILFVLNSI